MGLSVRLLCAFTLLLLAADLARADKLDEIKARGELIWGADAEGGGPFVFPEEDNPEILRGFEVELAGMLADELSRQLGVPIKATFFQGQWDKLPELTGRGDIDLALNGFELTPERTRDYLCTRPYYRYGLQLMVRRGSSIRGWQDLMVPGGADVLVGALVESAAEKYTRALAIEQGADHVEVVGYDGNTDAMTSVANGRLEATVQDDCIAVFYADRFPELVFVDLPVAPGYYVAIVDKHEQRLHAALNEALERIIEDGRLKQLYDRWDMSGRVQELSLRDPAKVTAAGQKSFARILRNNLGLLLKAAGMTIVLSVLSMPLAILIGILVAVGRLYGPWYLAKPLGLYVELIRGTPLMLQLYAIFFLLPRLEIAIPALAAGIIGLAVNYSAYEAEIYRAGIQAIPRGQMEAALSLGLSRRQAIWQVILPQAVRIVIPPVTNDFIALFKDTSVCSVITIVELTKRYSILALSTGAILELAIVTAVLYLLMSYPLALFTRWSEKKLGAAALA